MLKYLRYLIILSVALFLLQEILHGIYNPSLDSTILAQYKNYVFELANASRFFVTLMLVAVVLNAYSFAAMWFGYNSGRWSYILSIVLVLTGNYLLKIVVFSSLEFIMMVLGLIVTGMMLTLIFSSPLQDEFTTKKRQRFFALTATFILFLVLFFLPVIAINVMNPGHFH